MQIHNLAVNFAAVHPNRLGRPAGRANPLLVVFTNIVPSEMIMFRPLLLLTFVGLVTPAIASPSEAPVATDDSAAAASAPRSGAVENSVVKIFATKRYPEPFRPWAKQPPTEEAGSGVVIDGRRILTNAHVVLYASQIHVQANQSGEKLNATVEFVAPGIDLAVLKLEEDSFFDTHSALARADDLPGIKDTVMVYGYPKGGSSLSITKGIVSRIEFTPYNFPVSGLRIQVDAAINPGNSGGPVVVNDRMIGLAFSHLNGAENISYIIPEEEIALFLSDIADGRYDGKPAIFDETQKLQNPALRAFLRLPKGSTGVMVHELVSPRADYPLKTGDVITHIGETAIDDEGMIPFRPNHRIRFDYLVQKLAKDGRVSLKLMRDGEPVSIALPVSSSRPMLVPDLSGNYPPYFVFGPLVFSTATTQLIGAINRESYDGLSLTGSPLLSRRGEAPSVPDEQLVVISTPFLPHKFAKGYWPPVGWVVSSVNGTRIVNLRHLVETLRNATGEYVRFEFASRGTETIVLPRAEAAAATDEILTDNGIRAQASPELLAIWSRAGL